MASDDGARWPGPARGEVVWLYAFDIAYDMRREPLTLGRLLGAPVERFGVDRSKRHPVRLPFALQARVRLPELQIEAAHGPVRATATLKVLPVGALAIAVRAPVSVATLEDLVGWHEPRVAGAALDARVREIAQRALDELRPLCVRPVETLAEEEPYTVFCLDPPPADGGAFDALAWLDAERPRVAALLTQEPTAAQLSRQEIAESTARALSYYRHDLVVVDWDAALIVDDPSMFEQMLWVLELANVQLTELEAYDRLLEAGGERAYADLRARGGAAAVLRDIAELRVDLARLADDLRNIGKLYGDWHLARVHQAVADRFHLVAWHREVEGRLDILDDLYQLLKTDRMNRWMLGLELAVVLLFVADLALLLFGRR